MRRVRAHSVIRATLISLGLLLTAPDSGVSQDLVRSGLSADKPLSYHLSALHGNSWLTRYGIWARHEGMWAFRPTLRLDRQAYYRCQAGYGCGGLSWLPFGFGGWDLVPGGWMWFPGRRLARSRAWDLFWDLSFFSPRHMFRASGFGPQVRTPFAPVGWDGGRTATSGDHRPGQGRDDWKPPADISTRDDTRPLVHPVRTAPVVTVSADPEDSEPSGREAPNRPSIDPAMPSRPVETLFEPTSIQRARQKSLTRPEINRLEPTRKGNRLRTGTDLSRPPTGLRSSSPRAFESTKPGVFRNRVTTAIDRTPSGRSQPGATRPSSSNLRSAAPKSNGQSRSAGKKGAAPKQ
jgi:hypothetical protein